jgi:hypothetical protein
MEVIFMKNILFQDTFDQVALEAACSPEQINNFMPGNSGRKLHVFAAHLFRKWMRYDPENRSRYFHYVLSNVKETGYQDMSSLLTKTERTGENIFISK